MSDPHVTVWKNSLGSGTTGPAERAWGGQGRGAVQTAATG
jgi:hypothetical protein